MSRRTQEALLLELIIAQLEPRVKELVEYTEGHPEVTLAELEEEAVRLSQGMFTTAVAKLLEQRRGDVEASFRCGTCGARPSNKGLQERSQETLVGRVRWRRSYYYCALCRKGYYPLDEAWGIARGQFSEGVQKKVSRLAARLPFGVAMREFEDLTGVSISSREVERVAEQRGAALEEQLRREVEGVFKEGEVVSPSAQRPAAEGLWAVGLDAGKVHLQDGWHDADVGVVFRPCLEENGAGGGQMRCAQPSYVATLSSLEEGGRRLYVEACKRGVEGSKEAVICLSDGAAGNWKQFATHFPQRVEILDWYHAMEHLWAAGHGLYGEGTPAAAAWVKVQETALWAGYPHEVLRVLRALAEEPHGRAAAEEIHYFHTNQGRMHYDRYRAQGYPIGSGSAESGCKQLVGARLKQAGMRWSKQGAQAILNLRAALLSDRWDEAWQSTRPSHYLA